MSDQLDESKVMNLEVVRQSETFDVWIKYISFVIIHLSPNYCSVYPFIKANCFSLRFHWSLQRNRICSHIWRWRSSQFVFSFQENIVQGSLKVVHRGQIPRHWKGMKLKEYFCVENETDTKFKFTKSQNLCWVFIKYSVLSFKRLI